MIEKLLYARKATMLLILSYEDFTSYYWDVKAADGVDPDNYSLVINITDIPRR